MTQNILSLDQIRKISETNYEQLLDLYKQGYRLSETDINQLSEKDLRQTINVLEQKIYTLQSTTVSWPVMIIAIILALILGYYLLILRYKIEKSAAERAGVQYSAVGMTGYRGGLFG